MLRKGAEPLVGIRRTDPFEGVHQVAGEHVDVDLRMANWGRWARGGHGPAGDSPMFRLFRSSHARAYAAPTPPPSVNASDALLVERAVRELPVLQRDLLRAWYVTNMSPAAMCHTLAVKRTALVRELHGARTMAANRIADAAPARAGAVRCVEPAVARVVAVRPPAGTQNVAVVA